MRASPFDFDLESLEIGDISGWTAGKEGSRLLVSRFMHFKDAHYLNQKASTQYFHAGDMKAKIPECEGNLYNANIFISKHEFYYPSVCVFYDLLAFFLKLKKQLKNNFIDVLYVRQIVGNFKARIA